MTLWCAVRTRLPSFVNLAAENFMSARPILLRATFSWLVRSDEASCSGEKPPNSSTKLGLGLVAALEAKVGRGVEEGPLPWVLVGPAGGGGCVGGACVIRSVERSADRQVCCATRFGLGQVV